MVHSKRKLCAQKRGSNRFEGLFQPIHLLVIFGIALLVFGPKGFRNLGRGSERRFAAQAGMHGDEQRPAAREQQTSNSSA